MAVKPVQVDESEKDQPGVEAVVMSLGGREVTVYMKTVMTDDFDGATTEDVREVEFLWPEDDVEEDDTDQTDGEDHPVVAAPRTVTLDRMIIDLGPDSRDKLRKALQPFYDHAREVLGDRPAATTTRSVRTRTAAPSTARTDWVKRVKAWLAEQGQEVPSRRLLKDQESAYLAANPGDPRPE